MFWVHECGFLTVFLSYSLGPKMVIVLYSARTLVTCDSRIMPKTTSVQSCTSGQLSYRPRLLVPRLKRAVIRIGKYFTKTRSYRGLPEMPNTVPFRLELGIQADGNSLVSAICVKKKVLCHGTELTARDKHLVSRRNVLYRGRNFSDRPSQGSKAFARVPDSVRNGAN